MSACLGPGFQSESMDFTNSDSHAYPDVEGARDRSTHEPSTRNTAKGSIDPDVPSQKAPGRGFFDLAYELRKEIYSYLLPRVTPCKNVSRPPAIDSTELGLRTMPSGGPGVKFRFGDYSYYLPLRLVCKRFGEEVERLFFQQHKFIRMEKHLCKDNTDCGNADKMDLQMVCFGPKAVTFKNWTLGIWLNLHDTPPWGEEGSNHERMVMMSDKGPGSYRTGDDDVMMDENLESDAHDSASVGSSNRSAHTESWESNSSIDIFTERPLPAHVTREEMELYRLESVTRLKPAKIVIFEITELPVMCKCWMRMDLAYGAQLSQDVTMSLRLQIPPALAFPEQANYIPLDQQWQFIMPLATPKGCYRIIPHRSIHPSVAKELKAVWQHPYDSPQQCLMKAETLRAEAEELMNALPSQPEEAIKRLVQAFDAIHIDVQGRTRKIWADAWFEKELTDEGPFQNHDGFVIRLICRIKLVAAMVRAYTILGMKHQPIDVKAWTGEQSAQSYVEYITSAHYVSGRHIPTSVAQSVDTYLADYHRYMLGRQSEGTAESTRCDAEAVFWGMRSIHLMRARYRIDDDIILNSTSRYWWEDLPTPTTDNTQHPTVRDPLNLTDSNPEYKQYAMLYDREIIACRDEEDDREAGLRPHQEFDTSLAPDIAYAWASVYKYTGLALQRLGHPRAARILHVARLYDPTCHVVESALKYDELCLVWKSYSEAKEQLRQQAMVLEGLGLVEVV